MSKQAQAVNLLDTLTEHEARVFDLLYAGAKRSQIGDELGVTEAGVKYHLAHIYEKLGVRSRAEAVAYAVSVGREVVRRAGVDCLCERGEWSEAEIREAGAKLVKAGLGDRKQVNGLVTDLLLALRGAF